MRRPNPQTRLHTRNSVTEYTSETNHTLEAADTLIERAANRAVEAERTERRRAATVKDAYTKLSDASEEQVSIIRNELNSANFGI